jgi:hypothetical protein
MNEREEDDAPAEQLRGSVALLGATATTVAVWMLFLQLVV